MNIKKLSLRGGKFGSRRVSDSYKADSYDYKDYTVNIYYDDDINPFVDWDGVPEVYTTERIFNFGKVIDEGLYSEEDIEEYFKNCYYLPFYTNLRTSQPFVEDYSDSPDSANGFLVWEKGQYAKEIGESVDPYENLKYYLDLLKELVQGEVYAYEIENPDGDVITDYTGGYFGWDGRKELEEDAKMEIEADIKEQEKIAAEEAAAEEEWERGREDREFDEFWEKRGDIGDSVRRVSDGENLSKRLSKSDIDYLLSEGNKEEDLEQIEESLDYATFDIFQLNDRYEEGSNKEVSFGKAINFVGRKGVLSALARAAFHRSGTYEDNRKGVHVYIDKSFWD